MSAEGLYDDIQRNLLLTSRVVSKVGSTINADEKFTLRFTAVNGAYLAKWVGKPIIIFNNPRIFVDGTNYAYPVNGPDWHNLPDKRLYPLESSSVEIEFKAKEILHGFQPWKELIAKAWIVADLDQNAFFQIWNYIEMKELVA